MISNTIQKVPYRSIERSIDIAGNIIITYFTYKALLHFDCKTDIQHVVNEIVFFFQIKSNIDEKDEHILE